MKLIKPYYEIWEQLLGKTQEELLNGVYKQIEKAGRICYKSEDKITEDSASQFVKRLIDAQHYAMLEHGTIYLYFAEEDILAMKEDTFSKFQELATNKYSDSIDITGDGTYITTNYRVIIENHLEIFLSFICSPKKYHQKRVTVHFVCNRQVSHEFVRHRVFSFAQESTRYCNYSLGKFGNCLTFIKPCWEPKDYSNIVLNITFETIERHYFELINQGWKPQQAATILPNALKTELVMTGFIEDWNHFFDLRSDIALTGAPHPQAEELATPLREEFKKKGLI